MRSRTWSMALAIAACALSGCEGDAGEGGTPGTGAELREGASGQVEREHPGLEQTEQPIPRSAEGDDDWGVTGGSSAPATP